VKKPILITGTARSGVSLIGGVVHLCGAWGGQTAQINDYDGRGSFENMDIRNSVIRSYTLEKGPNHRVSNVHVLE